MKKIASIPLDLTKVTKGAAKYTELERGTLEPLSLEEQIVGSIYIRKSKLPKTIPAKISIDLFIREVDDDDSDNDSDSNPNSEGLDLNDF